MRRFQLTPEGLERILCRERKETYYDRTNNNPTNSNLRDENWQKCLKMIFFFFLTFFYIHIGFAKIFHFRFSTDLHVLRCPETIWPFLENVCLSVCRSVCLSVLFCGRCISRTDGRKLMKLNIQLHLYGT